MKSKSNQRGMTVIELTVALAVGLVFLLAVSEYFVGQVNFHLSQDKSLDMHQNARGGLEMMLREIRMAGYDPSGAAGAGLMAASATSVRFSMDLNGDEDIVDSNEDVTYLLRDADGDGDADLVRLTGSSQQLVAENTQTLGLSYQLVDGTTTTTPADLGAVRKVSIALSVWSDRPSPHYAATTSEPTRSVSGVAQLRNLKMGD